MTAEEQKQLDELKETVSALSGAVKEFQERAKVDEGKRDAILKDIEAKQKDWESSAGRKAFGADRMMEIGSGSVDVMMKVIADGNGAVLTKLMQTSTTDERIKSLQKTNDDIMIVSQLLNINPAQTKMYQDFMQSNPYIKAMDTTEDSAWVPTGYSARLFDKIRLELKVAKLHEEIVMPTNIYKPPVVTSDATGYLVSENTDNDADLTAGNRVPASQPGTSNFTLTAKKIAGRVIFSEEMTEDSIIPVLPMVTNNVTIAIATAVENAIINGDTSGTHQDSDVTSANDARKAWDGYRKLAISGAKVSLATFDGDTLSSVRAAMGKYGIDPNKLALVVSLSAYFRLLNLKDNQNNPLVTTLDKYGASATILSGELGKVYGVPIIVSEYVRENLNATGVYDGTTTTKTEVLLVYRPGIILGDRRMLKVKTAEDINTDQTVLVATTRKACASVYSGGATVGVGYNMALS